MPFIHVQIKMIVENNKIFGHYSRDKHNDKNILTNNLTYAKFYNLLCQIIVKIVEYEILFSCTFDHFIYFVLFYIQKYFIYIFTLF